MSWKGTFNPAGLLATAVLLAAGCGDGTGPQPPAELVAASENSSSGEVGEAVEVTVEARNEAGAPLPGVAIDFEVVSGGGSASPAMAETGSDGRATTEWTLGSGSGSQILRASASGISTDITIEATAGVPVIMEEAGGDEQVGEPGSTLPEPLRVRLLDQFDNPVPGFTVQFVAEDGEVDPAADQTDGDGIAETTLTLSGASETVKVTAAATGAGNYEFTAYVEAATLTILTSRPRSGRLTLDYEEQIVAISGAGDYAWEITGGSLPPGIVLDASTGILTGLPASEGEYAFDVRVEDEAGDEATRELTLLVCEAPATLVLGEPVYIDPPEAGACGFYLSSGAAGTRYRVGIVRPLDSENSGDVATARLTVRGDGTTNTPLTSPVLAAAAHDPVFSIAARSFSEALRIEDRTSDFHFALRREEHRLLERLGPGARLLPDAPSGSRSMIATAEQATSPDRRTFKPYPGSTCTAPEPRVAHLIAQNEHLAVYQDSIQRSSSPVSESHVQTMLDYYRDHGNEVVDDYFGGVSDIDDNGQVVVFISPVVASNVAAFVWSGDFFASSGEGSCAASNEMELVYFSLPIISSMGESNPNYQALPTLVHEVKHISSLYKRIRSDEAGIGDGLHPTWIEEGTAEIAGEMSSRLAWAAAGGPAVGAEVRGSDVTGVSAANYGTLLKLARTMGYLPSHPNSVTTNPSGAHPDHSVYGSGWHFHRFLGDAYGNAASPLADAELFREQNDSLRVDGTAAFSGLVGRSFEELLEEYTAAIMLNGGDAPLPERAFTTYDFPTATNVFTTSPEGLYPWPVTMTEDDDPGVPLTTATYQGSMGPAGVRVHEFVSNGEGRGADIHVTIPQPARLVIVRIQ